MRKSLADRAPFTGLDDYHCFDLCLTKAILDCNGQVVRLCGTSIDVHEMAREMTLRAALTLMIHGTAAEENAWKEERYNK